VGSAAGAGPRVGPGGKGQHRGDAGPVPAAKGAPREARPDAGPSVVPQLGSAPGSRSEGRSENRPRRSFTPGGVSSGPVRVNKLLREPVLHFFVAGAVLFLAHRLLVGEPRTVTVTRAVRADLARRYQDVYGRQPTADELAAEIHKWENDEALSREALREHLDRDDPGIRTILADKMRLRASFDVPRRTPTDAELDDWLAKHRDRYVMPARYDFEFVEFPRSAARAQDDLDAFEREVQAGKPPASLGRPVIGGNLTAADLQARVDPALAEHLLKLPPGGPWQRVETPRSFYLARLKAIGGGVPTRQELGERLVEDWQRDVQQQATDRILQKTLQRYRFEVEP